MANSMEIPGADFLKKALDKAWKDYVSSIRKAYEESMAAIRSSLEDHLEEKLEYGVVLLWPLIKSISEGVPGSVLPWENQPPCSVEDILTIFKALPESLVSDLLDDLETTQVVKEGLKDAALAGSVEYFKQLLYENNVDITRLAKFAPLLSIEGEDPANIIVPFLREGRVEAPPKKDMFAIRDYIYRNSKWFSPKERSLIIGITQKKDFPEQFREFVAAAVNGIHWSDFLNHKLEELSHFELELPVLSLNNTPPAVPDYKIVEQEIKRGRGGRNRSVWLDEKYSYYSDERVGIELRTTIWPKLQKILAPLPLPNVGNSRTKGDLKSLGAALLFYVFKQLGIASQSATYGRAFERTMVVMGAEEGKLMGKTFSAGPFARNSIKDHFAAVSRILPALYQLKDGKRIDIHKLLKDGSPLEKALINGHLHLMAAYDYLIKELPSIFEVPPDNTTKDTKADSD